jgi:hypothetical protein
VGDVINNREKYQRGWTGGLPETECGFGSKLSQTIAQRDWLVEVTKRHDIKSIADIGAGDLNWSKLILPRLEAQGCAYRGFDLVPRHKSVTAFDLLADPLPEAECYWCIWVLNHFPPEQARVALDKFLESDARYLVMQWEIRNPDFMDLPGVDSITIRQRNDWRGSVELRLIDLKN